MDGGNLRQARLEKKWTQEQTARALGVTQAYLSMLEKGRRAVSGTIARKAVKVFNFAATVLPLPTEGVGPSMGPRHRDVAQDLGALGYPGFAYLKKKARRNPAEVLLDALHEPSLDARVAEALPWLPFHYSDMNWDWLVRNAKLFDRQNRLGFAVALASEVAEARGESEKVQNLRERLAVIERGRLAREDTFCRDSMTNAERAWLRKHRSETAAYWNLLTDMKGPQLVYASE